MGPLARGAWTGGRVLTGLQQRVARIVADLPEARGFVLAGGAALLVHGLTDRPTNDLDFFTTTPADVAALRSALEAALVQAALAFRVERATEAFVRLSVTDGTQHTLVDLAWDARLRPTVATALGPVLHQEELAADKVLALFGRAEPRDFLDVYRLAQRLGMDRLLHLAQEKDAGFSPKHLAESLGRINRLDRADFGLNDAAYRALRRWVTRTQQALEGRQPPEPPGLGL